MPNCCVYKCPNRKGHVFPKDEELRDKWEVAIKRKRAGGITDRSIVCSDHFTDEDYRREGFETGIRLERKRLLKTAVPSVFYWNKKSKRVATIPDSRVSNSRAKPSTRKSPSDECVSEPISYMSNIKCEIDCEVLIEEPENSKLDFGLENIKEQVAECTKDTPSQGTIFVETKTVATQTTYRTGFTVTKIKGAAYYMLHYTGLQSYDRFKSVFNTLIPAVDQLVCRDGPVGGMCREDQFLMTIMKLRLGNPDFELAVMFDLSEGTVRNIFFTWIKFLASEWSELDEQPTKELTEGAHNEHSADIANSSTESRSQSENGVNILVEVAPGVLQSNFRVAPSSAFGGGVKEIAVEKSNTENDSADKMYVTKNDSQKLPVVLKGRFHHHHTKILKVRKLGSRRVPLDRLMEFAKTYRILKQIRGDYINVASEIFFVCEMLCNFQKCAPCKRNLK